MSFNATAENATDDATQSQETTPVERPAMPEPSAKFSEAELAHLWDDDSVSVESLIKIADGKVTSFSHCPADVVASLNEWAFDNVTTRKIRAGKAQLAELLGIEEVQPKFVPTLGPDGEPVLNEEGKPVMTPEPAPFLFSHKVGRTESQRFQTTKNSTNRPLNLENAKKIKRFALDGLICFNGESFIFDSVKNAISAQHRGIAYYLAMLSNPELPPIPILIVENIPAIFADTADTGRSRTDSDIILRDEDVLAEDKLVDHKGNKLGADAPAIRGKMGKELASVLRLVGMRFVGKNVNASKKLPPHYLYDMFDDSLDRLINVVYNQTASIGEKKDKMGLAHTLGRANLAAAIVLAELHNEENPAVKGGRSLVIPEPNGPLFTLDVDKWAKLLTEVGESLQSESTEGAKILSQIHAANKGKRQTVQDKFASICYLVSTLADVPLKSWKGKSGSTVYATPQADSVTAKTYPHFGGADMGYWEAPTKSAD